MRRSSRARDIKMTSSKKNEETNRHRRRTNRPRRLSWSRLPVLCCAPRLRSKERARRKIIIIIIGLRMVLRARRLQRATMRVFSKCRLALHRGTKGKNNKRRWALVTKKQRLLRKNVESYSSSDAWLERASEMERSKAPHSGRRRRAPKGILRPAFFVGSLHLLLP